VKKTAVIGAGPWGRNIVKTLHGMGVLHSVVEADPKVRGVIAGDFPGVTILADSAELLGDGTVGSVAVATPAPTHHRVAKTCLLAGKDVFVEKPITLTSVEAEDLVETAERGGRILMTGHLLLYKPAVIFLKEYLASGQLGRVFTFHQERMKHGKARSVENALWSLGVHDVAALLHLAGSAVTGVSFSGHCGLQAGIEDDTYLHLTFADGAVAHLHNSWLWPEDRRGLRVIGERGMLCYDEKSESVTLVRKTIDRTLANVDGGTEVLFTAPAGHQALEAELRHFLECVETRSVPRSCGRNGLEVVRILEMAGGGR
jgi:predicted dehydrogenase